MFHEIVQLDWSNYNPIPVRRIYVPKSDGRQRPIGIPTVMDRVLQMIVKNALEPEWEAYFEKGSYGFRPCRGVNDCVNRLFLALCKSGKRKWIVDAVLTAFLMITY